MAQKANTTTLGLVAIIIGVLVVMGGLMLLLSAVTAILLGKEIAAVVILPGVVQVLLGLVGAGAGLSLSRGNARAKPLLLFVAVGLVLNVVLLVGIVAVTAIVFSPPA
jgi:hypothetical protein